MSHLAQKLSKTPKDTGSSWPAEFLQPSKIIKIPIKIQEIPIKVKLQWKGSFPATRCKLTKEKMFPEELSHLKVGRTGSHSHGTQQSPLSPGNENVGKQIPAVWRGWVGRSHGT